MRDHDDTMRYSLQLDIPERDAALGNRRAIDLLRGEFALALNASYLMALSAGDIRIGTIWRATPQAGLTRYAVELLLDERTPSATDEQVADLLRREFARAQNASHFIRIAATDFGVTLARREHLAGARASQRAA